MPSSDGGHRRDAGVVDQHVDAAELGDGGLDEVAALLPVADVARHREGAPTEGPHLVGHPLALVELAAGDHDVGARLGEAERHRPTEALAAAGDHDDLVVDPERRDGHATPAAVRSSAHLASAAGRRDGMCSVGHPSTGL